MYVVPRPRGVLLAALVLAAAACSSSEPTPAKRCQSGACEAPATCDRTIGICVETRDACSDEGRQISCEPLADDCSGAGCRTCGDGSWSACGQLGNQCTPGARTCDGDVLVTCSATGIVADRETCRRGCVVEGTGARCNECRPGGQSCAGSLLQLCGPDGRIASTTDCAELGGTGCAAVGSCDSVQGCVVTQAPDGVPCDDGAGADGDYCNSGCVDGTCEAGAAVSCDDDSVCTVDACDPAAGCAYTSIDCSDGDTCTQDLCDPVSGCSNPLHAGACDDGNPCTTGETCTAGVCLGGSATSCNDDNPCTNDSCDPGSGCVHVARAGTCNDHNPCTAGDACVEGICAGATELTCDDGNPCTDDGCDADLGCVNSPNTAPCTDGRSCTVGDVCASGTCRPGPRQTCDDAESCTTDACVDGYGCTHAYNCPCTAAADCEDGNPCTTHQCLSGTCQHANPSGTSCDDGDPCTANDRCGSGFCTGTAVDCSGSSDPCNEYRVCDPAGADGNCDAPGLAINEGLLCDDGDPCTLDETCQAGMCGGGESPDCSGTGDVCNGDRSCDPAGPTGNCGLPGPFNDGVGCGDGLACTVADVCSGGACAGSPVACSAADDCNTLPTCDPTGIEGNCDLPGVPANDGGLCDDGDACRVDAVCSIGVCMGGTSVDCTGAGGPCRVGANCDPAGSEGNCDALGAPANENAPCDDGDACTSGETCQAGACTGPVTTDCAGTASECRADSTCDPAGAAGNCDTLGPPANDGAPCTSCPSGVCSVCGGGQCLGAQCTAPADCDDGNPCTDDACVGGLCVSDTNTAPCDDGDACTLGDTCVAGSCVSGGSFTCPGRTDCTAASSCEPTGAEGNCDGGREPMNNGFQCRDCPSDVCSVCEDGTCLDDACVPRAVYCDADGRTLHTCLANGSGNDPAAEVVCPYACVAGRCLTASNVSSAALAACDRSAPALVPPDGETIVFSSAGIECLDTDCGNGTAIIAPIATTATTVIVCVSALDLPPGSTLTADGTERRSLTLVVDGNAVIEGVIDFSGRTSADDVSPGGAGPGGGAGGGRCGGSGCSGLRGAGSGGGFGGTGVSGSLSAGGGQGGCFAALGGTGGTSDGAGGTGCSAYGTLTLVPLVGGSGGGAGGDGGSGAGGTAAGGGGGAIQITARGGLTVTGEIISIGGPGSPETEKHGAGGGGSGGAVLLEGRTVVLLGGTIDVDGGNGGLNGQAGSGASGSSLTGSSGAGGAGIGGGGGGGAGGRVRLNALTRPTCTVAVSPFAACSAGTL